MNRKMKIVCTFALSILMLLTFAACGGASSSTAASSAAPAASSAAGGSSTAGSTAGGEGAAYEPKVIGFAQSRMSHPYRVAAVDQFKRTIEEKGLPWEVLVTDGDNDTAKQTANVEDMISKNVDAIVMSPITADPLVPICQRVMNETDIPLILANRTISTDDYTVFVGGRNTDIGKVVAEDINSKFPDGAKVCIIEGTLGSSDVGERTEGFMTTKNDNIEVIANVSGDYQRDQGMSVMEDFLTKYKEIDAVFAQNDTMAMGALTAIQAAGREDEIKVYGADGQTDMLDLIEAGTIEGTVMYPTGSYSAVDVLIEIFNNDGVWDGPKQVYEDCLLCTIDNVDEMRVHEIGAA